MNKNAKAVALSIVVAVVVVLLVVTFVLWDVHLRAGREIDCGDGPRRTIDMRDFALKNFAYSLKLEGMIDDKRKISAELTPVKFQELTESIQREIEFRKGVVAGFNGCGVTKAQYAQFTIKFEALDALAGEIHQLLSKPSLSPQENADLSNLIGRYRRTASMKESE
jgi:hypothetical protein